MPVEISHSTRLWPLSLVWSGNTPLAVLFLNKQCVCCPFVCDQIGCALVFLISFGNKMSAALIKTLFYCQELIVKLIYCAGCINVSL